MDILISGLSLLAFTDPRLLEKEILETKYSSEYPVNEGKSSLYHNSSVRNETLLPHPQLLILNTGNSQNILHNLFNSGVNVGNNSL